MIPHRCRAIAGRVEQGARRRHGTTRGRRGAYRQSLATGPTSDVTNSTLTLCSQRATLEAEYQQKRTFMKPEHPEMLSLRSQIDELDKQIARRVGADVLRAEQLAAGRLSRGRGSASGTSGTRRWPGRCSAQPPGPDIEYNILQREGGYQPQPLRRPAPALKRGRCGRRQSGPRPCRSSIGGRADLPYKPNLLMNLLFGLGAGLPAGIAGAVEPEFSDRYHQDAGRRPQEAGHPLP